jgi:hypothetical protein
MAISVVTIASPASITLYTDTNLGNILDAVKASSTLIEYIQIDNTANAGAPSYLKLFNLTSGSVTLGTTAPDMVLYAEANKKDTYNFLSGANPGITFATALTMACVTTGGTAGTTSPASAVIVTVAFV